MAPAAALTPPQLHALFDILTHHETYTEIESFKTPDAVTNYGFPFTRDLKLPSKGASTAVTPAGTAPTTPRSRTPVPGEEARYDEEDGGESLSPMLQMLLTRLVLPAPGVRELPRAFWAVRVQGILARLAQADLSESYDKGALGTRKTLATGASAVIEMVGRGALGGVKKREGLSQEKKKDDKSSKQYDTTKAEDLERAWDDVVEGLVYGDLMNELFVHISKTDDMEGYSPAIKAAADYTIIHLATLVHHVFVLSPEGQYLLKLMENVHNLVPYKMLKQTLRVGNAATMINGMMRLLLAKLSVTSITNWVGLTANADDGMNLLQRIISLVLSWDASEFKKGAEKVEKGKEKLSDEVLQAIRDYVSEGRGEHEAARATSEETFQSIIAAIFKSSDSELGASLTDAQHAQCLEYYSALLSVRDREAITAVLCRQPPDLFTQMIKDAVGAYEPMIRSIHTQVDLREHLEAAQGFLEDFIRASKPKKGSSGETRMAGVEDYVELLIKNRGLLYRWIHALAGQCPDVWEDFRVWIGDVMVRFRQGEASAKTPETKPEEKYSSAMDECLAALFTSLPETTQTPILSAIDAHAAYLSTLTTLSHARLQFLITGTDTDSSTMEGPGVYLARWQNLLDATAITPANVQGAVRHGVDVKHATTMGKIGVSDGKGGGAVTRAQGEMGDGPPAPDVDVVVKELSEKFRGVVQELGRA